MVEIITNRMPIILTCLKKKQVKILVKLIEKDAAVKADRFQNAFLLPRKFAFEGYGKVLGTLMHFGYHLLLPIVVS